MDPKNLAKAEQNYNIQKKWLDPERYVTLDVFRSLFPDTFQRMMTGGSPPAAGGKGTPRAPGGPGGPGAPGGPGGPGGAGGPDGPGGGAATAEKTNILAGYLAGEKIDDSILKKLFGFTNAELEACLKENDPVIKTIPPKCVLMTFDDSTIDHYIVACPVLEKYGGKANLFTCESTGSMMGGPGFADKTKYMTWEQIKELSDRGHEICNHSWHHSFEFQTGTDEYILSEIHGLEERCAKYGIPKPTVFGAPGGGFTQHIEDLLHKEGYLWGRGDLNDGNPLRLGEVLYDPYIDTPMVVPNQNPFSKERLKEILDATANNKVALFVFHDVVNDRMSPIPFAEQVKAIYEYGGRCITFSELSKYVDPLKAYAYTH